MKRKKESQEGEKSRMTNTMTVTAMTTHIIDRERLKMKRIKGMMGLLAGLFLGAVAMVPPSLAADAPSMVVGTYYGDALKLFK